MQTILLKRSQTLTKTQYRTISIIMAFVIIIMGILNGWWSDLVGVEMKALSKPAFKTTTTEQARIDIASAYKSGLSVAKLSGLGAMGESQSKITKSLSFEQTISNDTALSVVLSDRKLRVQNIENDITSQIAQIQTEYEAKQQLESITCDPTNITKISNMTQEQMAQMLSGTWLEGKEETLYQVEQTEGINAFFVYAVATLESGNGTSYRAKTRSNYYGLETSADYKSYEENTLFFGDMINRLYISKDKVSVDTIGPTYCPPNREWEVTVSEIMKTQYEKISALTIA